MDWNAKVELFEQLRREHEFGVGTIAGVAAKFGVHRRMVRQAIAGALPPLHCYPQRAKPKLDAVMAFIEVDAPSWSLTGFRERCLSCPRQAHPTHPSSGDRSLTWSAPGATQPT